MGVLVETTYFVRRVSLFDYCKLSGDVWCIDSSPPVARCSDPCSNTPSCYCSTSGNMGSI